MPEAAGEEELGTKVQVVQERKIETGLLKPQQA